MEERITAERLEFLKKKQEKDCVSMPLEES